MSYKVLLFFIGTMPGMFCAVNFGLRLRKLGKDIHNIALQEGRYVDIDYDFLFQKNLMFSPKRIMDSDDSEKLAEAKKRLIGARRLVPLACIGSALLAFAGGVSGVVLCQLVFRR